jgi:hypothetical protein
VTPTQRMAVRGGESLTPCDLAERSHRSKCRGVAKSASESAVPVAIGLQLSENPLHIQAPDYPSGCVPSGESATNPSIAGVVSAYPDRTYEAADP